MIQSDVCDTDKIKSETRVGLRQGLRLGTHHVLALQTRTRGLTLAPESCLESLRRAPSRSSTSLAVVLDTTKRVVDFDQSQQIFVLIGRFLLMMFDGGGNEWIVFHSFLAHHRSMVHVLYNTTSLPPPYSPLAFKLRFSIFLCLFIAGLGSKDFE